MKADGRAVQFDADGRQAEVIAKMGVNGSMPSCAEKDGQAKYVLLLSFRSYTRGIRQLVDIGAFAEKEVIQ